ncbi:LptF/LptG family permease [Thalassoroseus pseudoceratinae]|uniref:LptF/LptG family permease n=1 Tax=Thalassoroseus pseudoceratinae TaxID=2713176 RepID=UPI001422FF6B|nr:LptF/LptG family permease [Thalassoroseus pseudoceratinae]
MLTTFDRYLIRSYCVAFLIVVVSMLGLFVVIDLTDNADEFARNFDGDLQPLVMSIAKYYSVQSLFFFDAAGSMLGLATLVILLIQLQRRGQIAPILAAGVPTFRLTRPLVLCVTGVGLLVFANREILIPKYAHLKHVQRGENTGTSHRVEAVYDFETFVMIDGERLIPSEARLLAPRFVLPTPTVAKELTVINGHEAHFETHQGQPGWRITNVVEEIEQLPLTGVGRQLLKPIPNSDDVFVQTSIGPDILFKRKSAECYLASGDIVDRIRNPAFTTLSVRNLQLEFHRRFVEPIVLFLCAMLTVPLMIQKETKGGLPINTAMSFLFLGIVWVAGFAFTFVGRIGWITPALTAWGPAILTGVMISQVRHRVTT